MMNVGGPPTRLALKARPYFIGTLAVQCLLVIGRFLIMDLWGAMLTLLVVMMGSFVMSSTGGIDITYCLYYGLMCLVNGIFDVILCLERMLHVKYPVFSSRAPLMFNVASAVFILCPLIELAATCLAAMIYMDAQECESHLLMPRHGNGVMNSYANPEGAAANLIYQAESSSERRRNEQNFTPFQGRAH